MSDRRAIQALSAVVASACLACARAPTVQSRPAEVTRRPAAEPVEAAVAARVAVSSASRGGLAFSVEPGDAEVFVDGRSFGSAADLARGGALPLEPGLYQVTLRRAGYATWRAEVAVRGAIESIRVTLSGRAANP